MDDLIRRQDAINDIKAIYEWHDVVTKDRLIDHMNRLPSAEREYHFDEWCTECKEYDQEKHCCPRFNAVIRTALEEAKANMREGEEE